MPEKGGVAWPSPSSDEDGAVDPSSPYRGGEAFFRKLFMVLFSIITGCLHCEGVKAKLGEWALKFPDLRIGTFGHDEGGE